MSNCPICCAPLSYKEYRVDECYGPICEIYESCPNQHYHYEYAYGSSRWTIGTKDDHVEFGGHYTETRMEQCVRDAVMLAETKLRRAVYLKPAQSAEVAPEPRSPFTEHWS